MAQVTGLHLRNGVYQLRVVVPKDLQDHYGKSNLRQSLGTSSRTDASFKATLVRAEWVAKFDQKRKELNPQALDKVTPELALQLAERVKETVLSFDDALRDSPQSLETILDVTHEMKSKALTPLTIGKVQRPARSSQGSTSVLDGLTVLQAAEFASLNQENSVYSAGILARRQLSAVLPIVQAEARKLGLDLTDQTPGIKDALKLCLAAYREAWVDVTRRDTGEVTQAVTRRVMAAPAAAKVDHSTKSLRDVFAEWKKPGETVRSADSIQAMDRALRQFEQQHPGIVLRDITRELGNVYRAWLRENCKTPKTARDRLTAIKSLLKHACTELEWTERHTWVGLDIQASTTNKRRAVTPEEMDKLLGTPLHTSYNLPTAREGGRDAAYWIPLIGAFTGARLGELCQLRTVDIQTVDGIHALVLTDAGEGQTIKSSAGHRAIPIHSELIRLGFLGYVEAMRKANHDSLWPTLPLRKGKPSDHFGRWFKEFREGLGESSAAQLTFHYFRHTVRPLMRRAGFDSRTIDRITGHATQGSVGDKQYDDDWPLSDLQPAVEAIRYTTLSLPVVSPHATGASAHL